MWALFHKDGLVCVEREADVHRPETFNTSEVFDDAEIPDDSLGCSFVAVDKLWG